MYLILCLRVGLYIHLYIQCFRNYYFLSHNKLICGTPTCNYSYNMVVLHDVIPLYLIDTSHATATKGALVTAPEMVLWLRTYVYHCNSSLAFY